MRLRVDVAARMLRVDDRSIRCSIGRSDALPADQKREGDGATPLGSWPIRAALLRPDRIAAPRTALPWRWLRPDDGWSDDPCDPDYNRPIRHPYAYSAERLWRQDSLYDVIVILGHNDALPVRGLGSAIFLHCWRDAAPTEGCVAIDKADLLALLPYLSATSHIAIG